MKGVAFLRFNPFGKILAVFFLIVAMIATSCASYVKVHPERINIQSLLRQGDTVKIVTKDNREIEFVVVEVSDEAIIGENETVLFTDISKLEEMNASAGRNSHLFIGYTIDFIAGVAVYTAIMLLSNPYWIERYDLNLTKTVVPDDVDELDNPCEYGYTLKLKTGTNVTQCVKRDEMRCKVGEKLIHQRGFWECVKE